MKNLLLIAILLVGTLALAGDQPQIINAKVEQRSASAGLEQQVRSISGTAWIGYAQPVIEGEHTMCCFGRNSGKDCCGACRLEDGGNVWTDGNAEGCAPLEPSKIFFVFLRVNSGKPEKARIFSVNCKIDAAGTTVVWLNDVKAVDSIRYLAGLAGDINNRKQLAEAALMAIAMHADPAADTALAQLMHSGKSDHTVEQATFWTGTARGSKGYETLAAELEGNQSRAFRKHAIFALSQNSDPRAQTKLIDLARHDSDADIRCESLFWLSQEAGKKAAGVISSAIENDPNTEVKKKAVFALSQLDDNEGIPLLIDQAKKNPNPVVRKEAIFWLGQSNDPRALEYITSVLEQ